MDGQLDHALSLEVIHEQIYKKSLKIARMKNLAIKLKEKIDYMSEEIREHLEHDELNQQTYHINDLSVTVINPVNYKLNVNAYLEKKDYLRSKHIEFVRRKVTYEIDKRKYTGYLTCCNPEDKEFLESFADKNIGSPKVTVRKNQDLDYDFI